MSQKPLDLDADADSQEPVLEGNGDLLETIRNLRYDNVELVSKVGLLEDKVTVCESEITTLKSYMIKMCENNDLLKNRMKEVEIQSMRSNLMVLFAPERPNEQVLKVVVDLFVLDKISVELSDFTVGRRLGFKKEGKIRPILVTCARVDVAQHILMQYRKFSDRKIGIKVLPHLHNEYRENRSRLHTLAKDYKIKGAKVEVKNDHFRANNQVIRDQVVPPSAKGILLMSEEDKARAAQVSFVQSGTKFDTGSSFTLCMTPIKSHEDARVAYNAMSLNPEVIRSSHLISAYRLTDGSGTYRDDGDFGMGMQLHNCMENRKISGAICFLVRRFGGVHLGPRRFRIVLDLLDEVMTSVRISDELKALYPWSTEIRESPPNKRFRGSGPGKRGGGGGRAHHSRTNSRQNSQNESIVGYMIPNGQTTPSSQSKNQVPLSEEKGSMASTLKPGGFVISNS